MTLPANDSADQGEEMTPEEVRRAALAEIRAARERGDIHLARELAEALVVEIGAHNRNVIS